MEKNSPNSTPGSPRGLSGTSVEEQLEQRLSTREDGGFKSYLRVQRYTDPLGWVLNVVGLVAAVVAGCALPLMNLVFGSMVTNFTNQATGVTTSDSFNSQLNQFTLYFVYLFIGKFVLVYIWTVCLAIASLRTTKALRIDFVKCLLGQDMAFFDKNGGGSPVMQVTSNANLINQGFSEQLGFGIQGIATFVAAFCVAFAVQWKLTLITACIVPIALAVASVCSTIYMKREQRVLDIQSSAESLATEALGSVRTVHAFSASRHVVEMYRTLVGSAKDLSLSQCSIMAILFSSEFFCVTAGYSLAFWQGVRMHAKGEIEEPGDVLTVIFAVIMASTAMSDISPQIVHMTKAASAAKSMWKIIDTKSYINGFSKEGTRPTECTGYIDFKDISFAYPTRPEQSVLQNFSLSVAAKSSLAIVGSSGSGKSTITALLERWYDPDSGSITIDGIDVRECNTRWLRTNIRIVQQEPILFNGTIYENVAYGMIGSDYANEPLEEQTARIIRACKAADAHLFIESFPEKYNTQVGERGSVLSGGQRQRIAIARSIISDPKILILDEATSALDPEAERAVQRAIDHVSASRTTITIAHRLSTVQKSDQIIVLSHGKIIEQGTHEQLHSMGGTYHRLVKMQDLGNITSGGKAECKNTEQTVYCGQVDDPAVIADVGDVQPKPSQTWGILRSLFILITERRELWPHFSAILVVCAIGGGTYPVLAFLFAKILDVFQISPPESEVKSGDFYALMFFVVAIVTLVVYAVMGWVTTVVGSMIVYFYRMELFQNFLSQNITFYDLPQNTIGSLVSHLSNIPLTLQELLSINIALMTMAIFNIITSSIFSIAVGWKLGLTVVSGVMLPMILCAYLRLRLEIRLERGIRDCFSESAGIISEAVASMQTIASLTLEPIVLQKYTATLSSIEYQSIKSFAWTMLWLAISQSIIFLCMALGFWYGGRLLLTGEYTTTQLYIVIIGAILSGSATSSLFMFITTLTKCQAACNYMFSLRSLQSTQIEDRNEGESQSPPKGAAHLIVQKLQFHYPTKPDRLILRNLEFEIQPGQSVAFVGPSGHGKSSIISLLERYYNPTSGCISLDGIDITSLQTAPYRSNVSLVQQEPVLFGRTIRENITMGLADVTEDQITKVCHQANIWEFISSLQDGIETMCGSRGTLLSGGQRQRITIARALLREPRLLLLDEATSSLDSDSEKIVQVALDLAKVGRTTIAIAHRLSTIKHFDWIFVLVGGCIREQGTHSQLLDRQGIYYQMCLGQSLG